jgi:carbamoyl-phosphate synthase large subunit
LDERIRQLCRHFEPEGPTNLQFRRDLGEYLLLEINPRISSSTSLRAAFGFNEAEACIRYYLEGRRPQLEHASGGSAVRFIEDWVRHD